MLVDIIDGRPKGYLMLDEFAIKAKVSRSTIQKRIKTGELETVSIMAGPHMQHWIPESQLTKKDIFIDRRRKSCGIGSCRKRELMEDYPFNLVHEAYGNDFEWEGTDDQIAGLNLVLRMLTERERGCIECRYEDRMIYDDISHVYNVTRERIRQILAKAIRKLNHPIRKNYIQYGLEGYDKQRWNHEYKPYNHSTDATDNLDERLDSYGYSEAFMSLELSIRAFNCLARANIKTVAGIVEQIKSGDIIKVRNLGRKSLVEIVEKVERYYGKSIDEIIGVLNEN